MKPYRVHMALTIDAEDADDAKNCAMILYASLLRKKLSEEAGLRDFKIAGTPADLNQRRRETRAKRVYRPDQKDEEGLWGPIVETVRHEEAV